MATIYKVLIPLPSVDFDPSETSIPWKILKENGYEVFFATPNGKPGSADFRMLTGKGLGIWKPILIAHKKLEPLTMKCSLIRIFKIQSLIKI
ncbi:hypothetical protein LEP1GSC170_2922 [Leptospira interrogans serovar Bataviae str. HAI135]|nr:hypothetical protein LEP1GSC170_2922 [Leptospira interrogans serovar Bataviae str. HAI135]